jgi:protein SCO1
MNRRLLQVSTGILLGLTVSALLLYPSIRDERIRLQEEEMGFLLTPLATPDFALTTQAGEPFSSDELRGRFSFVFFGFTNCPDVCPVTLMNLTRALQSIPDGAERVQGVLISVDPERDTPERLRAYMRAFDPSFIALTGEESEIRAAASGFGVFFARGVAPDSEGDADDLPDPHAGHGDPAGPGGGGTGAMVDVEVGGYGVDHTARSYVLDPDGRIVLTFPPFATAEQIARALTHLLSSS